MLRRSPLCLFTLIPVPLLTGRPFDPQVPIVQSTTRVIGALVFGHHFLSEEPIFLELIQAINLGLAFASTIWRRVIGFGGGWYAGNGNVWIQVRQEPQPGSGWEGKHRQEAWQGLTLGSSGSRFCLDNLGLST